MRPGWLRVSVFTALVGVALASGYRVVLLNQQIGEGRSGEREFTENAWRVTVALSELRTAQQAYVAADADHASQAERTAAQTDAAVAGLAELTRLATAPGAGRAIEAASEAVGDLQGVGAASREHVAAGETELARDLLLTDGADLGAEAAGHVARALGVAGRTDVTRDAWCSPRFGERGGGDMATSVRLPTTGLCRCHNWVRDARATAGRRVRVPAPRRPRARSPRRLPVRNRHSVSVLVPPGLTRPRGAASAPSRSANTANRVSRRPTACWLPGVGHGCGPRPGNGAGSVEMV